LDQESILFVKLMDSEAPNTKVLELIAETHKPGKPDTMIFQAEMPPAAVYIDEQTNYTVH
jgi:hypothetical protein